MARRKIGIAEARKVEFYEDYPEDEVTISQFEELAKIRLKALQSIERNLLLQKEDSLGSAMKPITDMSPSDDRISHFILRLAFSKTENQRRWFLSQECEVFKWRLQARSDWEVLAGIIAKSGIQCQKVPLSDIPSDKLWGQSAIDASSKSESVFKVPFEQALDLVRQRRAVVINGIVYLSGQCLLEILVGMFRTRLSEALTLTSKKINNLEENDRVMPLLDCLSNFSETYASKSKTGSVVAADVPQLAKESFPLCMRHVQDSLNELHHVKHGARLQYGLFLKGIGLSLQESLLFWKSEFTKIMPVDKFDKEYSYNVRHSYGQEGRRKSYDSYNCVRIITSNAPSTGDAHGCPFKHFEPSTLKTKLQRLGLSASQVSEIQHLVQSEQYGLACGVYFDAVHKLPDQTTGLIEAPNQYFDLSRELKKTGSVAANQPRAMPAQNATTATVIYATPTPTRPAIAVNVDTDLEGVDFSTSMDDAED